MGQAPAVWAPVAHSTRCVRESSFGPAHAAWPPVLLAPRGDGEELLPFILSGQVAVVLVEHVWEPLAYAKRVAGNDPILLRDLKLIVDQTLDGVNFTASVRAEPPSTATTVGPAREEVRESQRSYANGRKPGEAQPAQVACRGLL